MFLFVKTIVHLYLFLAILITFHSLLANPINFLPFNSNLEIDIGKTSAIEFLQSINWMVNRRRLRICRKQFRISCLKSSLVILSFLDTCLKSANLPYISTLQLGLTSWQPFCLHCRNRWGRLFICGFQTGWNWKDMKYQIFIFAISFSMY